MNAAKQRQIGVEGWPGDTSLDAYRRANPLSRVSVYEYFFEANKHRIKVQNPSLAIPKLQLIIESIFRISSKRGFHAMSLRDLCQESGLSMGGVYNYISSKEDVSKMITEFVGVTFVDINQALLPPLENTEQRLEALIRAHIYMSELYRSWYFFVYMETKNQPAEQIKTAIQLEQKMLGELQAVIDDGISAGIYRTSQSTLTAAAILSMIQDWYLKSWHFKGNSVDATSYADFVVDAARRLLGLLSQVIED